jgi:oligopeptidase B
LALVVVVATAIFFASGCCRECSEGVKMGQLDLSAEPPVAKKVEHTEQRHGEEVQDPYYWLRDDERKDPAMIAYLEAENAYTAAVMKPTEEFQQALYDEMLARIKETDLSAPVRHGDYYYYTRTEEGKQYRYHCRKKGSLDAEEEILLDENALAEGHDYFRIGVFELSPDHNLLAFATDHDGGEHYTLRIKDLRSGAMLPDTIPNVYYSVEWAADNKTLFYNTVDEAHRPYRLYRHTLGSDPAEDVLVHEEEDDAYFLGLYKTSSKRFLILKLDSQVTSELRYLRADDPQGSFEVMHPRQHKLEYWADHWGDSFYIVTNDDAVNFKVVEAPVADPTKRNWRDVIPHRDDVKIDTLQTFSDHMAVSLRENGLRGLRVIELPSWNEHNVEFPEPVYTVYRGKNPEFETTTLRFIYQSMVTPDSVFDYDMKTRQRELKKQEEVLGGYDPTRYRQERLFATAADGTRVPISMVYKTGMQRNGANPTLLHGYGSYGASSDPTFDSKKLSLLDRGFIVAIAHVRGGGEMGRPWYENGKLLHKRNTFTDFIACAEHLIAENYTSSQRLAIRGGSAGGLLMGALANMRPDLFEVVVALVPFVDVITTMLDPTIPLTVIEWEEWGDPRQKDHYDYMRSYSPYDNVEAKSYPDMFITSGLNDPRVAYWEPAKWTAKLRATKQGDGVLLLKTNMGAGHGGASGRYDALKELALEYTFVMNRLGVLE